MSKALAPIKGRGAWVDSEGNQMDGRKNGLRGGRRGEKHGEGRETEGDVMNASELNGDAVQRDRGPRARRWQKKVVEVWPGKEGPAVGVVVPKHDFVDSPRLTNGSNALRPDRDSSKPMKGGDARWLYPARLSPPWNEYGNRALQNA